MVKQKLYPLGHCDISTGKIYGCKKGSWKYYHEEGHLRFNNNPKLSLLIMIKEHFKTFWIFALMVTFAYKFFFYISVFCWLVYFEIGLYEEHWCNRYAFKQIYKRR